MKLGKGWGLGGNHITFEISKKRLQREKCMTTPWEERKGEKGDMLDLKLAL